MKNNKGFTLIELLVVISIIGILASVVLVSFPSASAKAKDSRIIAAISQMRTSMTYLCENENNCANLSCTNPSEMVSLCADVNKNTSPQANPTIRVSSSEKKACIYAKLNSKYNNLDTWYCTDMTGVAGNTTSTPDDAARCGAGTTVYGCGEVF